MKRRLIFWQLITEQPRNFKKRHLIIALILAPVIGILYYIGDGFLGISDNTLPLFLYGSAYHELLLLLFSGIIIYAAFVLRTRWALALSLFGLVLMLPHALIIPAYLDPIYRILSWFCINILLALVIGGILNAGEQQQTYLRDIINAQEQERHRLSRELHDDTAQGLIDAAHAVDEILDSSAQPNEELTAGLKSLRQNIDDTLEKTRRAIQGLQPPLPDEVGIKPALLWLCESLSEESGIEIDTDIVLPEEQITQEAKIVLFRVTQEALSNVKKHSRASNVDVKLMVNDNKARLTIIDDGVGFIPVSRGKLRSLGRSGLVGIQQRVNLINGSFQLHSRVGEGTTIRVETPLLQR